MTDNLKNNSILRNIIIGELPSLDLSRREKRILRKRCEEKMLLLDIAKEERPSLTRERVRQIILEAKKKEEIKEKVLKKLISRIEKYYAENNPDQEIHV